MGPGRKLIAFACCVLVTCCVLVPLMGGIVLGVLFGKPCVSYGTAATSSTPGTLGPSATSYLSLFSQEEQVKKRGIVQQIVDIGLERQFSIYSIQIAVATAIQESNITNYGNLGARNDKDSLGIYQQRPSQGWGTAEQILTPTYAINKFYDALGKVVDRDQRPMIDVAIQVQRPNRAAYQSRWHWDETAKELVADAADPSVVSACQQGGWQLPLDTDLPYYVSDPFGMRLHPILGVWRMHNGIDLAGVPIGTPVHAAHGGVVSYAAPLGTYGNYVKIDHGDNITTAYAHLVTFGPGIEEGVTVSAGQVIGYVGNTGGSTGAHLHFEVIKDGQFIEPSGFLKDLGLQLVPDR